MGIFVCKKNDRFFWTFVLPKLAEIQGVWLAVCVT